MELGQKIDAVMQKIFGNRINVIRGDSLVTDRYLWLLRHVPFTQNGERLLDVGCGSGAFTIATAEMGYYSIGLSWDEKNQNKALFRSKIAGVESQTEFPIGDVRKLATLYKNDSFDVILNFENIEHVLDDQKLFYDMYALLKKGGFLYLTTPYYFYKPMSKEGLGPFSAVENGNHVRRGYSKSMLVELCSRSGLNIEKIDFCSGFASQYCTKLQRFLRLRCKLSGPQAWALTLPLRPIAYLLEFLPNSLKGRCYSICLIAQKPRF